MQSFLSFISSVDIRDRDPNAAKRWSDESVFSNRAYFLFDKLPGELAVQNAKDSDTGTYTFRLQPPKSTSHPKTLFQVSTGVVSISR